VGLLKLGLEMTYAVVLLGEFVLKGCDTLVKALEFVDECLEVCASGPGLSVFAFIRF